MNFLLLPWKNIFTIMLLLLLAAPAHAVPLANPIIFVTQPPIPRELNSSVSNTFLSVVTIFGNQQADTAHAARGGDLWLMTTNSGLVNLTRKAGFGTNGIQHGIGIDVRDPQIHWSGKKVLFSMVAGAPTNSAATNNFFWQLYELTNLDAVMRIRTRHRSSSRFPISRRTATTSRHVTRRTDGSFSRATGPTTTSLGCIRSSMNTRARPA